MQGPIDMSLQQPLVSIVIPTYNRMPFILEAVRSVTAQTYTNWELIIADDGSGDNTVAAINALHDNRIKVLELPHIGHIGWLRNIAAWLGKGKWICFLDSDDAWINKKLEIQLNSLEHSGKLWGYGRFELMNESAAAIAIKAGNFIPYSGWITQKIITAEAAVSIGSLIVDRELFKGVGCFNTNLKLLYREDYELALRLSLKAEADAVDELLLRVREHKGRSTNMVDDSFERTAQTYTQFLLMNPVQELVHTAKKRRGYHLAEAAGINIRKKRYLLAGRQFGRAWKDGDKLRHLISVLKRAATKMQVNL